MKKLILVGLFLLGAGITSKTMAQCYLNVVNSTGVDCTFDFQYYDPGTGTVLTTTNVTIPASSGPTPFQVTGSTGTGGFLTEVDWPLDFYHATTSPKMVNCGHSHTVWYDVSINTLYFY